MPLKKDTSWIDSSKSNHPIFLLLLLLNSHPFHSKVNGKSWKVIRGWGSWLRFTRSRVRIPLVEDLGLWLHCASLHWTFHYLFFIASIWLKYGLKRRETPNHHHSYAQMQTGCEHLALDLLPNVKHQRKPGSRQHVREHLALLNTALLRNDQSTLFISIFVTTTKFVLMAIWLARNRRLRGEIY